MSYHDWHVGMKVVYIGGLYTLRPRVGLRRLFYKWDKTPSRLKKGGVYEIGHIGVGCHFLTGKAEVGVQLKNDPDGICEGMHPARYFRPVQPRKTDISIFTGMLTGTKVPA